MGTVKTSRNSQICALLPLSGISRGSPHVLVIVVTHIPNNRVLLDVGPGDALHEQSTDAWVALLLTASHVLQKWKFECRS